METTLNLADCIISSLKPTTLLMWGYFIVHSDFATLKVIDIIFFNPKEGKIIFNYPFVQNIWDWWIYESILKKYENQQIFIKSLPKPLHAYPNNLRYK